MDKRKEIFKQLVALSVAMGSEQKPERLEFYAEQLKEFELQKVISAITKIARTNKFFPQLVEIIEPIRGLDAPTDEIAVMIANEIIESLYRCGSEAHAQQVLGEKYPIVQRMGGWESLSRIDLSEIPATRAQLRELAKAYINRTKREMREDASIEFELSTRPVQVNAPKGLRAIEFENLT